MTVLEGIYAGPGGTPPEPAEPVVVFAGRHIPEKQAPALVPAIALARQRVPELRGVIFGNGPARPEVLRLIAEYGLVGAVQAPGFVGGGPIARARFDVRSASRCRRGARDTASWSSKPRHSACRRVVVSGPDNAATELVEEGENGAVANSVEP